MKNIPLIILAGGLGTRISEETYDKPKPMIKIGNIPIIVHLMNYYSSFGINNFIICLGYRGDYIKDYFSNYFIRNSDIKIDLKENKISILNKIKKRWKISLIDTGQNTMTGGRIKRALKFIGKNQNCFMTYGDGLSNVDLLKEYKFHIKNKKLCTIMGVSPDARFGELVVNKTEVLSFKEKISNSKSIINGGFFVINKKVEKYIEGDQSIWEKDCLPKIVKDKEICCFKHDGFWQPMDTLREKNLLEELWKNPNCPWKLDI